MKVKVNFYWLPIKETDANKATTIPSFMSFLLFVLMTIQILPILQHQARSRPSYVISANLHHLALSPSSKPLALPHNALIGLAWNFVSGLFPQEVIFSLMLHTLLSSSLNSVLYLAEFLACRSSKYACCLVYFTHSHCMACQILFETKELIARNNAIIHSNIT